MIYNKYGLPDGSYGLQHNTNEDCDTYISLTDLTIKARSQREAEWYLSLIEKMIPEIKIGYNFLYKKRDTYEEK